MPSLSASMINAVLAVTRPKLRQDFTHPKRSGRFDCPPYMIQGLTLGEHEVNGRRILTLSPPDYQGQGHVLYFHGGAYAEEINTGHWFFLLRLMKKIPCRISVVDYPLAPEYSWRETLSMSMESVLLLQKEYPDDNLVFMGDSAGGGLALVLMQELLQNKTGPLPRACVGFSPWLDLSMENPATKKLERTDHLLSVSSLKAAAAQYAKGLDLKDSMLSPYYGEFKDCPPVHIFYSSTEILGADCRALREKLVSCAPQVKFYEFQALPHAWPIFPVKETGEVLEILSEVLVSKEKT